MHFLLTNDDGIHAPGLAALTAAISSRSDAQVTVVAPSTERSMCGHRITAHEPITVNHLDEHRHSIDGTPADCVRVALYALGIKPDFVISGINAGGNLGQDLYISGTLAAAREAAYHGVRAAAFSHYMIKDLTVDWSRAGQWMHDVLDELLSQPLHDGDFWNVNLPHHPAGEMQMPSRVSCHPCRSPLNVAYEILNQEAGSRSIKYSAAYSERPVDVNSDVAVCFGGSIAITKLRV